MPPKEQQRSRYWWLVALGLAPVLLFVWFREDLVVEEGAGPSPANELKEFEAAWPTPELPPGMDDFIAEAMGLSCGGGSACHLVWADRAEVERREGTHVRMVALVAHIDGDDRFRQTWAEWNDRDGPGETEIGEPSPLSPDAAVLQVSPAGLDDTDGFWLFPEGAEEIEELRHSEDGLVSEELRPVSGDHFERVRTLPLDRPESTGAGRTAPILRYQDGSAAVYGIGGDARVCVDDPAPACHTMFPSEEALVSLRTLWDHQHAFSWGEDDQISLDDSVEIDPGLHGALEEPLSEGTGHAARVLWQDPRAEDEDPRALATYAVYFDDGAPAMLGVYRRPESDTLSSPGAAEAPEGITGMALFPQTGESGASELVPIAFHPSGRPPLVAPELAEEGGDAGYTVYEPLETDHPAIAYTALDEEGHPLETGWLRHGQVRP